MSIMKQNIRLRHWLSWTLGYLLLWSLVTSASGYYIGLPASLAAAALSLYLGLHTYNLRLRYAAVFVGFFLHALLLGGWDVARRALSPSLPIDPAWVRYPMRCHSERVRLALSALVGLLPGTLSTGFSDNQLTLHVLDQGQDWAATVTRLENHLCRLLNDPALTSPDSEATQ